jgi:MFS family permease
MADVGTAPPFWSVVVRLWSLESFRWLAVGTGMNAFGGYALVAFLPLFLYTSHHMSPVQIGVTLALLTGIPCAIGTFFSGVLADRCGKREPRALMFVPMIGVLIAIPFGPIVYLSQSTAIAIAAAIIPAFMGAIYVGPALAATQSMVPPRMRATAVALFLFILNIIGLGLGPVTVGWVSDLLHPSLGADSLRWALMLTLISGSIAALCYWRASRTLARDMSAGQTLA